jgi:tetrahydromethanopterin S-methyltransferase subunit F
MSIINQIDNYDKNNIESGQFGINANREDIVELSSFLPADIIDPNLDKTFINVNKIRSYKNKLIERNKQLQQVVSKRKVSDVDIENDIDNKTSQINSLKSITESEQFKTSSFYNYQGKRVRGSRILQVIKQLENDIKDLQQRQGARLTRGESNANQEFNI